MILSPGAQLGPFTLVERIASGGMAEIYLAKTKSFVGFEKFLAVKVIHPNLADDDEFVQMLIAEAKLSVGLTHTNIVQVFDLGRDAGHYYIAMEYIDGADLSRIYRGASQRDLAVPEEIILYVGQQVCAGLDHAHRRRGDDGRPLNIIHRDISPQNILVSASGNIKIADFGIAKAATRSEQTRAGVIKGKYYYMSPEQARGDDLDPRSDLFSLGLILYEGLAGQPAYSEDNIPKLLGQVQQAEIPPLAQLRPDLSPGMREIIDRCLRADRAARWSSAAELQEALTPLLYKRAPEFTPEQLGSFLVDATEEQVTAVHEIAAHRGMTGEALLFDRNEEFDDEHSVVSDIRNFKRKAPPSDDFDDEQTIVSAPIRDTLDPPEPAFKPVPGQPQPPGRKNPALADTWRTPTIDNIAPEEAQPPTDRFASEEHEPPTKRFDSTVATTQPGKRIPPAILIGAPILLTVVVIAIVLSLSGSGSSTLLIESRPAGASIVVNGKPLSVTTPTTIKIKDKSKPIELKLSLAQYRTFRQDVSFTDDDESKTVTAILQPEAGRIDLHSTPPRAEVFIGKRRRGITPITLEGLDLTREAEVTIKKEGYRSVTRRVFWNGRNRVKVDVKLKRIKPAPQPVDAGTNVVKVPVPVDAAVVKVPPPKDAGVPADPSRAILRRAWAAYSESRYVTALDLADKVLKLSPGDRGGLTVRGLSACYLKKKAMAEAAYRKLGSKGSVIRRTCRRNGISF